MSGFAYQKLNGGQTTANKQLDELIKANEALEVIEDAILHPEIYKMAKMYFPDAELTPIYWNWQGSTDDQNNPSIFNNGKRYYGQLQVSLFTDNVKGNTGRTMATLHIADNGVRQMEIKQGWKGDNGFKFDSKNEVYTGVFDTLALMKFASRSYRAYADVVFQGFEVGESGSYLPPTGNENDVYAIVEGLSGNNWVSAGNVHVSGLIQDEIKLGNGFNMIEDDLSQIVSNVPFTAYYGSHIPLSMHAPTLVPYFRTEILPIPLNKNIYVFFGDHEPPAELLPPEPSLPETGFVELINEGDLSGIKDFKVLFGQFYSNEYDEEVFLIEDGVIKETFVFRPIVETSYIKSVRVDLYDENFIFNVFVGGQWITGGGNNWRSTSFTEISNQNGIVVKLRGL